MPLPLGQEGRPLPPHVQEIVTKARTSWLKNAEVLDILLKYKDYQLQVGTEAPNCPVGKRSATALADTSGHETVTLKCRVPVMVRWLFIPLQPTARPLFP